MEDKDLQKLITHNLAELIKASKLNQTIIAEEIGVSKQVISDYIAGRSFPTIFTFRKLCDILGCNYEDILG